VSRARRKGAWGEEFVSMDAALARSIVLTRNVRERLRAPRPRGEYASVAQAARDVVGRLQAVLPEGSALVLSGSDKPTIVAADRGELRRLIVALVERGLEALAGGAHLELDVTEAHGPSGDRPRRNVLVELRSPGRIEERDADGRHQALVAAVRALGGTIVVREPLRGGSVVSVRLPSAS
jgi:signal transduction histidine kinase